MNTKNTIIISVVLIALSLIAGIYFWNDLPESMASHWNMYDQVDGTTTKFWGVFLMPVIVTSMLVLFLIIPGIDPMKENIASFRDSFNLFIVLIIFFMTYINALTLAWNLGILRSSMGSAIIPAVGLVFIAAGQMISKAKRNYFIGIRTPWTLANDEVWDKTHAVGGKVFVAMGILTLFGVFLKENAYILVLVSSLGGSFFTVLYSYIIFKNLESK